MLYPISAGQPAIISKAIRKAACLELARGRRRGRGHRAWGGGKWHMEIFRSVNPRPEDWNGRNVYNPAVFQPFCSSSLEEFMKRARFFAAATLVGAVFAATAALAQHRRPMSSVLAGKKFTPPLKGA